MPVFDALNELNGKSNDYFTRLNEVLTELHLVLEPIADHIANGENPHLVNKSQVGLGSVINMPLASPNQARRRDYNLAYMSPMLTHIAFDDRLKNMKGETGSVLFSQDSDTDDHFAPGLILQRNPAIVEGGTEMDFLKGYIESFEAVFEDWLRISHNGVGPYPAEPSELDEWSYDASTDTITCSVNSRSLIGFISPDRHEDFIFEVTLRSNNADDDSIGVCFGFVTEDGQEHTLTAMRTTGGSQGHGAPAVNHHAKLLDVYYDIFHPDNRLDLGSTNGGLMWGDGIVDDDRTLSSDIGSPYGWNAFPDGCRLRVERVGDVFTIRTSNLNEVDFVESATVVVDINDYPQLEKFRGPIQFGYVCFSQNASTWEVHRRPVELGTVLDAQTLETWQWTGEDWGQAPDSVGRDLLLPNRLYFNEQTEKLFYNEPFRGLMKVSG